MYKFTNMTYETLMYRVVEDNPKQPLLRVLQKMVLIRLDTRERRKLKKLRNLNMLTPMNTLSKVKYSVTVK